MDTPIGYLDQLHEDLLDAAFRARHRRARAWSLRDRFSIRALVAAASVVTLVAAGTVGWFVTQNEPLERAESAKLAQREPFAMPSPSPAPGDTAYTSSAAGDPVSIIGPQRLGVPEGISRVIRTADLTLILPRDTFEDRFGQAADLAESNGGFVATSTTRERSGSITIRVPADRFNEALASLRKLGDVDVQTIKGQDVTAQYVDLTARLRIAKARREVLLGLMAHARTIPQTIRVQNALDETQLRIEELQGQTRLLDDRTSLATIRLGLREQGVEPQEEVETPSIPNAFDRSIAGFVGVVAGVVVGLGYVIPVALLGLALWFVISRIRRRMT